MVSERLNDRDTDRGSFLKNRSLQIDILTAMVGMLVITIAFIAFYNYRQNTKVVLAVSDDLIGQVRDTVMEKTINYLQPASVLVEMGSRIARQGVVVLKDNNEELEAYAIETLKAYPQLAMFNIGDEQGNFLMPKKQPDKTIATKIIYRSGLAPGVVWKYRNLNGEVIKTESNPEIDYDPRTRPWYIGAKEAGKTFWTDIYILFTDRKPGITAGHPVYDTKGNLSGVFSLDIELGAMSDFLKTLKVGQNGVVFIINSKNEMVAFPDASLIIKKESEKKLRPVNISEFSIEWIRESFLEYQKLHTDKFNFSFSGKRYIASYTAFPKTFGKDWKIAVVVPEDDFTGGIKRTNLVSLLISLVVLCVSLIFATILSRNISKPIMILTEQTKRIKDFQLDEYMPIQSSIREIRLMTDAIRSLRIGLKAFRKYVPAELVRQLIKTGEEARLGGQQRELSVFFSDIAGFTTISEKLSPENLMLHLSEYLDELTQVIMEQQGTVDKYIGDAIMGFWGAPIQDDDHAFHACKAAFLCQKKIRELNIRWSKAGKVSLPTRIGINTGDTVVGNMGSGERMNYTVIGDTVNLASRLEGVNKVYNTQIIISQTTYQKVADRFIFRPLDIVAVKGKEQGIRIYELLGMGDDLLVSNGKKLSEAFTQGFEFYLRQEWDKALKMFLWVYKYFPGDQAAKMYCIRCKKFKANPPGPDWDGIVHLKSK